MAFYGCKFTFDGVSCDAHQLMIYNIGSDEHGDTEFAHTVSVQEELVGSRWKPLFFGVTYENKLESEIVFGLTPERIEAHECLTRQEMAAISSWLAGHQEYKWLEIEQDDLLHVRYRCMVTELKTIYHGDEPWAFSATLTCDGPYAYLYPTEYTYQVNGELDIAFNNLSDHNGYYSPVVIFTTSSAVLTEETGSILTEETGRTLTTSNSFSIENQSCGYTMAFSNMSYSYVTITVDCENGVVTGSSSENFYKYFNFRFLKLKRGINNLRVTGNGVLTIRCEFPVSVGM